MDNIQASAEAPEEHSDDDVTMISSSEEQDLSLPDILDRY